MHRAFLLLVLCSFIPLSARQKPERSEAQPEARQPARAMPAEQVRALRDDVARMKVLVHQMETNLAFVDTTQSALKHQFQLEIDMWNTVIAEMERRLAAQPR